MIVKIRDCDTKKVEINSKKTAANCYGKKHLINSDNCAGCVHDLEFSDFIEVLAQIPAADFCKRLGNEKAIRQNSQTRTKKRHISKIEQSLSVLDKLGFKISIEPKNQGNL